MISSKEKLIKDGYIRKVDINDLPPNSWQREWTRMGNSFHEFNPSPVKVMGQIAKHEARVAERQNAREGQALPLGQVAVEQASPSELVAA